MGFPMDLLGISWDFLRIGKMGGFLWGQVRTNCALHTPWRIRVQKTRPQNHQKFGSLSIIWFISLSVKLTLRFKITRPLFKSYIPFNFTFNLKLTPGVFLADMHILQVQKSKLLPNDSLHTLPTKKIT